MSDVSLTTGTDVVPSSSSDRAIDLIRLKLASVESEASELIMLLADDDSLMMSHTDAQSSNGSTFQCGDDAVELVDCRWKCSVVSPILPDVADSNASQEALVSRVCRLEGTLKSFHRMAVWVSCERDHWRKKKLSSDERSARTADTFKTEMTRLRKAAETECVKAVEAKEKAERITKQLHNDLLQSVSSLVCVNYVFMM